MKFKNVILITALCVVLVIGAGVLFEPSPKVGRLMKRPLP